MKIRIGGALSNRFAGALAPIVLLIFSSLPVSAQTTAGLVDPLFQRVLTQPSDLNNTQQYAVGAREAGDIESAISTYEQLLFYNPKLSKTRFELGALYFRLGSYEMAREYFRTAIAMPDATPELREKAEEFLAVIAKKLQPDQFSGFVQTGLNYQTNPGAGPGPQTVLASGQTFDSRFFAHGDGAWFGAFGLDYVHDFENNRGDTFEASAIGYDAQQFRLQQFDIGLMELRAGPRFGIFPEGANGVTIKPYVVAAGGLLADTAYYAAGGGGLTMHLNVGRVGLDPYVEIVQQSFRNSGFYPLASGMDGTLSTYAIKASGPDYSGLTWQSRVAFSHASAAFFPYSYDSYVADVYLPWNFSVPQDSRVWTVTPTVGVTHWAYSAPDPTIDPLTTPHVTEWRAGVRVDVPIWKQVSLGTLVLYRADTSNVPAFAFRDFLVSSGPTLKF